MRPIGDYINPVFKTSYVDRKLRPLYPHDPSAGVVLNPLDQLIHSILSQKTTTPHADIAFMKLFSTFNRWEELRDARFWDIPPLISACSWPDRKAERIQGSLKQISQILPKLSLDPLLYMTDEEATHFLKQLRGVGPKTSAAVLLFSTMRRSMLPVDSHYHRVTIRLGLLPKSSNMDYAHALLRSRLPLTWSADEMERHYIAVKRHGQQICRPTNPHCDSCCLREVCSYYNRPIQLALGF
jgi:endonuclease-3